AIWEFLASIHSGEPAPKTFVMSPVGSAAYTVTALPLACAFVSGAVRLTVVPTIVEIVAVSARTVPFSRMIVRPGAGVAAEATVMLVSPTADAAPSVVFPVDRVTIAVVFSWTMFAEPTAPTSHPARVYGTQGAGAFRLAPVPPRDGASLLSMLKFASAEAVGGLFAGLPPSVLSVQYLNDDENPTEPAGRK